MRAHGAIADHGHDPRDRWPSCYASDDSGVFRTTLQLLNVVGPAVAGALPASLSGPMDYGLELTTVADDPAGPPPDSAVTPPRPGGTAPIDGDSQPSAVGQGLEDSVRAVGACISMAYVTMASTVASALPTPPPRPVPPIVDGPEEAIVFCRASFRDWAHDDENLVEVVGLIAAGVSELITPPNDEATAPSLDSRRRAHVRSHVTSVRLLALFRCLTRSQPAVRDILRDPTRRPGIGRRYCGDSRQRSGNVRCGVRPVLRRAHTSVAAVAHARRRTDTLGRAEDDVRFAPCNRIQPPGRSCRDDGAVMMYAALCCADPSGGRDYVSPDGWAFVAWACTRHVAGWRQAVHGARLPAAPRSPAHLTLRPGERDNGSGGREMLQSAP